jgi:UDP-2,3-diacylglucosamine pyrophosphatase LpxH
MPLLIVISDLHLGSGSIDDFEPEIENHFVAFLENLRALDDAVELVINGDLLDFVQAPPYKGPMLRDSTPDGTALCFTEDQSCQKLSAIFNDHQRAFAALGAFLAH